MKIILSDETVNRLFDILHGSRLSEDPRDRSYTEEEYDKMEDELVDISRDHRGYFEVSRLTFDWVMSELDYWFGVSQQRDN